MLMLPILLSSLVLTPVKDELWWRTPGGEVTEHRDRTTADCTLRLDSDAGSLAFIWARTLPTRVVVEKPGWTIAPDRITTVAIRIGDVWLDGGDGTPNIPAMTGSSAVMLVLNRSIDTQLQTASDFTINAPDIRFGIRLTRLKMQALLTALDKCRQAIAR